MAIKLRLKNNLLLVLTKKNKTILKKVIKKINKNN